VERVKADSTRIKPIPVSEPPTFLLVFPSLSTDVTSTRTSGKRYGVFSKRLAEAKAEKRAAEKKADRDAKIHDNTTVRTYDFKSGLVKDHRSGKSATIKQVLGKGRIDLLR